MIAMVTFTLFALALALPGLVTLAMCDCDGSPIARVSSAS